MYDALSNKNAESLSPPRHTSPSQPYSTQPYTVPLSRPAPEGKVQSVPEPVAASQNVEMDDAKLSTEIEVKDPEAASRTASEKVSDLT